MVQRSVQVSHQHIRGSQTRIADVAPRRDGNAAEEIMEQAGIELGLNQAERVSLELTFLSTLSTG